MEAEEDACASCIGEPDEVRKETKDIVIKDRFRERYAKLTDFDRFIDYSLRYLRRAIRANTLKMTVEELKARLADRFELTPVPWCREGFWIEHKEGRRDIGNTMEHALGYYYVQEPASMIPPIVLGPKPGEMILDLCASPGSKTTQIAMYMENQGVLIANDYKPDRMKPLGINIQRMGITNAVITLSQGHRFRDMVFDRILVDAPCSGTGTIRKSLKTLKIWNPNMVKRLHTQQKLLLTTAYDLLRPGGTLVYSTCTLEPEEDEGTVTSLLQERPGAGILPIDVNI